MFMIPITIRTVSFTFLIKKRSKYNFINPALLDFFEDVNAPTPIEERLPQDQYEYLINNIPFEAPLYFEREVYSFVGIKWVWRRGLLKRCKVIRLNFECEGVHYSEEFIVDNRLFNRSHLKNERIVAIIKPLK